MAVEISIDFSKDKICLNIIEMLQNKMVEECEKEWLSFVVKGTTLKKADANQLVKSLLSALSLHNSKSDKSEEMNDDESLSQSLKLSMKEKEKEIVSDPAPGQSGLNKNLLPADRNQDLKSKKTLCKFYRNGRCKYGVDCKFDHPKMCHKFKQFGDKKFNEKGCVENCSFFHQNVCRDSQKSKTCSRENCRFFHLNGTKKTSYVNPVTNTQNHKAPNFQSKNRYETLRDNEKSPEIDQNALSKTLEAIMRDIADLRADQNRNKQSRNESSKNSSRADWRTRPDSSENREISTQSQRKAWESPSNYRSQEDSQYR